ncbi:UDP-3-O-acyl-N-acetylglucosamine deacetylase [Actinophytocola sp.]|uniref:UDP-3-O-acyl-N-acetylglucosamine deacetylase n=1 Tax=Actinophytocola sp. TaxID=1872138 RepID=UPI00389B2CE4
MTRRRTVSAPVTFTGLGLHSGRPVTVRVHPADTGIAFRCGDSRVAAAPAAVTDTRWHTTLGAVGTVEHLMSAFAGLEITDAEVELSYPELPALDGSAAGYVAALRTQPLGEADVVPPLPRGEVVAGTADSSISVRAGTGVWSYTFRHGTGARTFTCRLPRDYPTEVAPARTIAVADQVPAMRAQGLGRGLDESSVVLLTRDGYANTPRFPDEPARHKLLDLAGDLYLTGIPVGLLDVTASFSGHSANIAAAVALLGDTEPAPIWSTRPRAPRRGWEQMR